MPFDLARYLSSASSPRTATISFPELKDWTEDGDTTFVVRSLTAEELYKALAEPNLAEKRGALADALASGGKALTDAVKDAIGAGESLDQQHIVNMALVEYGCVEPCFQERGQVVQFFARHPSQATKLANRINNLTAMGAEPGKPLHSTPDQTSTPP